MLTSGTAENEDGVEDAHLNVAVSLVTRKERDRIDCDDKIGVKRSTPYTNSKLLFSLNETPNEISQRFFPIEKYFTNLVNWSHCLKRSTKATAMAPSTLRMRLFRFEVVTFSTSSA